MKYYAPSIFNAYNICPRQAWLMYRHLNADQFNDFIEIGRLIDETTFKREKKKVYLADLEAMIDMILRKDGTYCIAEIKKSSRTLSSGIFQLKYYLYLLKYNKSIDVKGIIKIPKERVSKEVILTSDDEHLIESRLCEMSEILLKEDIPSVNRDINRCKKCGHFEFCWT